MVQERTLSIIKPDAVRKKLIGTILMRFEQVGLKIVAAKMLHMTQQDGEQFYAVHQGRPFYQDLVTFISSGPVLVTVLEGENAVAVNRQVMGATDPKQAAAGTIRADFAESIEQNAVHGSDAVKTAHWEIDFFFKPEDIF